MKKRMLLTGLLYFLVIFSAWSQGVVPEKASPFTAVRWEKELPQVQFQEAWYAFEKLDDFDRDTLLTFCKKEFGPKWKKRFSEDLVEVLKKMGNTPEITVQLWLSKDGKTETYTGTFTAQNRRKVLLYNRNAGDEQLKKKGNASENVTLTLKEALQDLEEFQKVLETQSSYIRITDFDYRVAIKNLALKLTNSGTPVHRNVLADELARIMAQVGDRHSSIKNETSRGDDCSGCKNRFPFAMAALNGKAVALKKDSGTQTYTFLYVDYPYVKEINGVPLETFIAQYAYRHQKAPEAARLTRGLYDLRKIGALLAKNGKAAKTITVTFTDGKKEKKEVFTLNEEKHTYYESVEVNMFRLGKAITKQDFSQMAKRLEGNIGFIAIPQMLHYDEVPGLEAFFTKTMADFKDTEALIIDLRYNPGGGRGIIQTFAKYLVPSKQSPWVANVAYLRSDSALDTDESSMSGRYLHPYGSLEFSETDRQAITAFQKNFHPEKKVDPTRFSTPFYMVLRSEANPYRKPVYLLVNESCFSASTVFTTAFKGLPNVKIAGVTTDGSSGNSRKFYLKNSNIRVKVSTMLSFQRNGKTLDGNGTQPDIFLPSDKPQLFNKRDSQLEALLLHIRSEK